MYSLYSLLVLLAVSSKAHGLSFGSLGDWGLPVKPQAKVMSKVFEAHNISFLLALGDNFYEEGVKSVNDPQWKTTFEDVYTQPIFQKRWEVIEGNHDHRGNVTAQVDYTRLSKRWYLPDLWYTTKHAIGGGKTLEIVHIDTIVLAGQRDAITGKVVGASNASQAEGELEWIKKTLASSTADWLVVVGHYPVYSVGEHGSTEYLIKHVLPLMLDNKVAMYVDGHDHGMQHNFDGKMHFFVSGAGAKSEAQDHHNLPSPAQNKYAWPKDSGDEALCLAEHFEHCYGFMVFDLEPTSLTAHIYSSTSGKKKYSVNVPNPRA